MAPPAIRVAAPRAASPAEFLAAHYRQIGLSRMQGLPFVNAALSVESIGFARHQGDWLGIVITPWFMNLFLLKGEGGTLWRDIAAGERRQLSLPCGALEFIADDDPDIGPYQYCPLIAPVSGLADMGQARQAAQDALQALFTPAAPTEPAPVARQSSRRGFLRGLGALSGRP